METKNNIFKEHLREYLKANKQDKSKILNHVCFITKMHRNSAMRKFRSLQFKDSGQEERRGRSIFYTPDVISALKEIWEIAGKVCGELLHPIIKEYVEILIRDKQWEYDDETTDKLFFMSQASVKRKVGGFKRNGRKAKGLSATKPSLLKTIIPVFSGPWENKPPGCGQVDTVVHCGRTLFGDYAYTLNYSDMAVCWTILRAQWNKGQEATILNMSEIKRRLPYLLLEAHYDSGMEFLNWAMVEWGKTEKVELSRSRPNHKNDNMFVEERNGHVVRKFAGYQRLDCPETVFVLNELYGVLELYLNHFIAVRRCLKTERIGSKTKRIYEKQAKTPYQRVLEHPVVSKEVKEKLKAEHFKLNPLILRKEVERLQKKVYNTQQRHENLFTNSTGFR